MRTYNTHYCTYHIDLFSFLQDGRRQNKEVFFKILLPDLALKCESIQVLVWIEKSVHPRLHDDANVSKDINNRVELKLTD